MRYGSVRALWPLRSPGRTLSTYAWSLRPQQSTQCSPNGSMTVGQTHPTGCCDRAWLPLKKPGGRPPYLPTEASNATPATWQCTREWASATSTAVSPRLRSLQIWCGCSDRVISEGRKARCAFRTPSRQEAVPEGYVPDPDIRIFG